MVKQIRVDEKKIRVDEKKIRVDEKKINIRIFQNQYVHSKTANAIDNN